jgi:hypothetical protein
MGLYKPKNVFLSYMWEVYNFVCLLIFENLSANCIRFVTLIFEPFFLVPSVVQNAMLPVMFITDYLSHNIVYTFFVQQERWHFFCFTLEEKFYVSW